MSAESTNSTAAPIENARYYYLAAEYRRSALWVILGVALILPLIWYVNPHQGPPRGVAEKIGFMSFFALFPVWMTQYLIPRIRVDEHGISRRILWFWDLWSWEEFSEGKVKEGVSRSTYVSADRASWRQRLAFIYLKENEAHEIDGLIRRVIKEAPPTLIPDSLEIKLGFFRKKKLLIAKAGLDYSDKQAAKFYNWDEVKEVILWRLESDRRDFKKLTVKLPDREIDLLRRSHDGSEVTNWEGDSSDVISKFMTSYVDRQIVRDYVENGPSRSLEEAQLRFEMTEKRYQEMQKCCFIIGIYLLSIPFMLWNNPKIEVILWWILYGIMVYAIHWFMREQLITERKKRDQFRDEIIVFSKNAEEVKEVDAGE